MALIQEARRRARLRWASFGALALAALVLAGAAGFYIGRGGGAPPGPSHGSGPGASGSPGAGELAFRPGPVRFRRQVTLPPSTAPRAVRQAFAARRYSAAPPREAGRVRGPRGPVVLWASPAYGGGWCEGLQQPRLEFNRMSVSCIWPNAWLRRRIVLTGYLPRSFSGRVPQRSASSLRVRLTGGQSLTEPIRNGFFLFTVPDSVLAHAGPQALVAQDRQGRLVAREPMSMPFGPLEALHFGGIRRPPGGADLSRKHRLVVHGSVAGPASIWTAPSSLRSARCTWLEVDRGIYGGGCRRQGPPASGLAQVVPLRFRVNGRALALLWGQAGLDVTGLEVLFQDGTRTSLPRSRGVFLYPVPAARWKVGHRPAFLVAHGRNGGVVAKRLLYEYTLAPR
jgi:hypothetical protein